ncbi:hypothetical protein [Tunturiibacter lichenicola]|uniref:hypothetical protein n=1 Tax=Tunturiibacter lichenicola TaxID=2051959 RepID=UPI003D9BDEEE
MAWQAKFLRWSSRASQTAFTHKPASTDRIWAARYNTGDVLQYNNGSKAEGIERGSFATVQSVDA